MVLGEEMKKYLNLASDVMRKVKWWVWLCCMLVKGKRN